MHASFPLVCYLAVTNLCSTRIFFFSMSMNFSSQTKSKPIITTYRNFLTLDLLFEQCGEYRSRTDDLLRARQAL